MTEKDETSYNIKTYSSDDEINVRLGFAEHFRQCPIPDNQILSNLGLFVNSKSMSRLLFMNHI